MLGWWVSEGEDGPRALGMQTWDTRAASATWAQKEAKGSALLTLLPGASLAGHLLALSPVRGTQPVPGNCLADWLPWSGAGGEAWSQAPGCLALLALRLQHILPEGLQCHCRGQRAPFGGPGYMPSHLEMK